VTLWSPLLSNTSVMALPTATVLPASVKAVSFAAAVTGLTTSGSSAPVAVMVTCWVEVVNPSLTVTL
jgi:hypothetical protein